MSKIWLIGAGSIAKEYAKVLNALGKDYIVIGRGKKNADLFYEETGKKVIAGGLDSYLETNPDVADNAIIAVNVQFLASTTIALMKYGVKRIFCEKPGFNDPIEFDEVVKAANDTGAHVFYAYNRRFYASTLAAEKVIEEDGGLLSFNFEFTEWGHVIATYGFPKETLDNWFYANSTHVIDLAFFLGGNPVEMTCLAKDKIDWHEPSNFAGVGKTDKGALFNYQANWDAPGRWSVELLTAKHRIYLKPMEQLQLQDKGSVKVYPVEIDDHLDKDFKPGFYLETKSFLEGDKTRLCPLEQQVEHLENIYKKICNPN